MTPEFSVKMVKKVSKQQKKLFPQIENSDKPSEKSIIKPNILSEKNNEEKPPENMIE